MGIPKMKTFEHFHTTIGSDMWGMVNTFLQEDNKQIKKDLVHGLKEYFYFHQYDEERYPHFRACDKDFEHDERGEKNYYFIFYDDF
jgi:hypothetical protein